MWPLVELARPGWQCPRPPAHWGPRPHPAPCLHTHTSVSTLFKNMFGNFSERYHLLRFHRPAQVQTEVSDGVCDELDKLLDRDPSEVWYQSIFSTVTSWQCTPHGTDGFTLKLNVNTGWPVLRATGQGDLAGSPCTTGHIRHFPPRGAYLTAHL